MVTVSVTKREINEVITGFNQISKNLFWSFFFGYYPKTKRLKIGSEWFETFMHRYKDSDVVTSEISNDFDNFWMSYRTWKFKNLWIIAVIVLEIH